MGAQKAEQVDQQTTLVVETLEQVAAATVRRTVLRRALEVADLDAIPGRVEDLTFFVSGPLYEAAQSVLGEGFADELLLELAPVLDRAWHDDRATVAPPSVGDILDVPVSSRAHSSQRSLQATQAVQSHVPTSNVRKKSAIQRVANADSVAPGSVAPGSVKIGAEDVAEKADTIPAADDELGEGAEGAVGDTIPGAESGRPNDSGRGASAAQDWTYTDAPPASSDPGALLPPPPPMAESMRGAESASGRLRAVTVANRDETPPPPRSSRFTVPYLQAVLAPPRRRRRIMIIDGHDEPRRALATALENDGYAVVTAHDRGVARTLFHRLAPTLIIADVETIAPDFEPLGPAFEDLLGGSPPSIAGPPSSAGPRPEDAEPMPPPRVLLLSDGATRSVPPEVDCVVERTTDLQGILQEVEGLVPLEAQRPR